VVVSGLGLEIVVGGRLGVVLEVGSGSVSRWGLGYGEWFGGRVGARSRGGCLCTHKGSVVGSVSVSRWVSGYGEGDGCRVGVWGRCPHRMPNPHINYFLLHY
jgi:hypothetical protein